MYVVGERHGDERCDARGGGAVPAEPAGAHRPHRAALARRVQRRRQRTDAYVHHSQMYTADDRIVQTIV